jgi:hypothetical protein
MCHEFSALSARFKEETAAAHRRLESTPLLRRLISPLITLDDYREIIGDFLSVWSLLEPAVHTLDGLDGNYPFNKTGTTARL